MRLAVRARIARATTRGAGQRCVRPYPLHSVPRWVLVGTFQQQEQVPRLSQLFHSLCVMGFSPVWWGLLCCSARTTTEQHSTLVSSIDFLQCDTWQLDVRASLAQGKRSQSLSCMVGERGRIRAWTHIANAPWQHQNRLPPWCRPRWWTRRRRWRRPWRRVWAGCLKVFRQGLQRISTLEEEETQVMVDSDPVARSSETSGNSAVKRARGQSGRSSSGPQSKNTKWCFSKLWRWRVIQRLRSTWLRWRRATSWIAARRSPQCSTIGSFTFWAALRWHCTSQWLAKTGLKSGDSWRSDTTRRQRSGICTCGSRSWTQGRWKSHRTSLHKSIVGRAGSTCWSVATGRKWLKRPGSASWSSGPQTSCKGPFWNTLTAYVSTDNQRKWWCCSTRVASWRIPTQRTSVSLARRTGHGTQSSAISMWVPLGGVTTATAVAGWDTSQTSARLRKGRRKEKKTEASMRRGRRVTRRESWR